MYTSVLCTYVLMIFPVFHGLIWCCSVCDQSGPMVDPKQVSSRELLDCSVEQLIADINAKRKRDAVLLEGMRCITQVIVW